MVNMNVMDFRTAWDNFVSHVEDAHDLDIGRVGGVTPESIMDWDESLALELAKFKAHDVPRTCFIKFETEKDLTLFLLKWS